MLLENKKVTIIGAGPVGLTMAKLLQQKGIDVTVYERDKGEGTRISGGTLDLHKGSGQDALEKAGLLEQYYALALPMGRTVADEQGNIIFSRKTLPGEQYDNPEINRNDLRKLLLESLTNGTVVWDKKITALEENGGKWLLHFQDETAVTADFVIGANGGMSNARKFVTDAEIEYTGTLILQGEVAQRQTECAAFYELCNDTILMASNNGDLCVANPRNGGILSFSVMFKQPEEWAQVDVQDTESIRTFLLHRLSQWHESYKQLIRASTSFIVWSTRKISLEQSWKKNRPLPITLIGDAAHIMPPFAGQGVNSGLRDALILSDNLTNGAYETIEAAISDYEQKMFVYAGEAQFQTGKNEAEMFRSDFSFKKRFDS